jgi:hypothetical protein
MGSFRVSRPDSVTPRLPDYAREDEQPRSPVSSNTLAHFPFLNNTITKHDLEHINSHVRLNPLLPDMRFYMTIMF